MLAANQAKLSLFTELDQGFSGTFLWRNVIFHYCTSFFHCPKGLKAIVIDPYNTMCLGEIFRLYGPFLGLLQCRITDQFIIEDDEKNKPLGDVMSKEGLDAAISEESLAQSYSSFPLHLC